jgi:hypothetical protein
MYKNDRLVNLFVDKVQRAEARIQTAMSNGRAVHEPTITDRFLGYLESSFDGDHFAGVSWQAKTLTSIGSQSEETRHGADFFCVLDLRLPGYRVAKGFLGQAKRIEPGMVMSKADYSRLRTQCNNMLTRSPVSYVFLYSQMSGIRVVSAIDVLAAHFGNPLSLTTWSLSEFFRAHLTCFIGDLRISAAGPEDLEALALDVRARAGIYISGNVSAHGIPMNRMQ